jgi:hypothetical protein
MSKITRHLHSFTLADLVAWLRERPDRRFYARDSKHCPVAAFLREQLAQDVEVFYTTAVLLPCNCAADLPEPLQRFIREVDQHEGAGLTADEARAVLQVAIDETDQAEEIGLVFW